MSHRCNLSTSAVRDSVSARKPPIQPTPITDASTVFTARFLPGLLPAHKDHDEAECANSLLSFRKPRSGYPESIIVGHVGFDKPGAWIPGSELRSAPDLRPNTLLANSG